MTHPTREKELRHALFGERERVALLLRLHGGGRGTDDLERLYTQAVKRTNAALDALCSPPEERP